MPRLLNPKSSILNPQSRRSMPSLCVVLLLASCTSGSGWNEEQQAIYAAMRAWSAAVSKGETETLWGKLSPQAHEWYERELTGHNGVRTMVKMDRAALAPDALTPAPERARIEARLKTLPKNPEKMSPRDYYAWRVKRALTPESAANTSRLFERENVKGISVKGDTATVTLHHGDPDQYHWKKVTGDWKFDLRPSILRELEETRRTVSEGN